MNLVLDSSAMLALFYMEDGREEVARLLAEHTCYAHAVNLCEVYYDFVRSHGEKAADRTIADLSAIGVLTRDDMDTDFWRGAGRVKADHRRVSLADCFCVTLARRLGAEVVTSDRHEFEALANAGVCKVRFVR